MQFFRTSNWGAIEEVDIASDTASFVVMQNGRKEKKITDWRCYFKTYEAAKNWRIRFAERELRQAEQQLQLKKEKLAAAEAL